MQISVDFVRLGVFCRPELSSQWKQPEDGQNDLCDEVYGFFAVVLHTKPGAKDGLPQVEFFDLHFPCFIAGCHYQLVLDYWLLLSKVMV